ncbi:MAG: hypothetical protein LUD29_06620 [Clostridia bacterium]|nr:hypothetical protein [Clostridia bacterium]
MANAAMDRPIDKITDMYNPVSEQREFGMTEDQIHNSHIRENYLHLVDPYENAEMAGEEITEPTNEDLEEMYAYTESGSAYAPEEFAPEDFAPEDVPISFNETETPGETMRDDLPLNNGARASSFLFRADSPVNLRFMNDSIVKDPKNVEDANLFSEASAKTENVMDGATEEDCMPSATTIQYKDGTHPEDTVKEQTRARFFAMSEEKKRRVTFGALAALLFALVVMVIVNSAVISHLSKTLEASAEEPASISYVEEAEPTSVSFDVAD